MWIIYNISDPILYWSNHYGWTSYDQATRFDDYDQHVAVRLPILGDWIRVRG